METTITIKCTPQEHDLLRVAVRSHAIALAVEKEETKSPSQKHALITRIDELNELDQKL